MSMIVQLYHDTLLSINRGMYKGSYINAKPILMLAIIQAIDSKLLFENRIYFCGVLETIYKDILKAIGLPITPLFKPYYYLLSDKFWHIQWKNNTYCNQRPSKKFIQDNIDYAYLDNALWDLLQIKENRDYFRKSIEDYYLK